MKLYKLTQYLEEQGHGSISQLSSKLGISKEVLRQIFNGTTKNPSVHIMAKIAEEFNCSIEELIGKSSRISSMPTINPNSTHYDKKLLLDASNYVINFISEKINKDSLDIKLNKITDSIEAIYDYSYKKNPKLLDTQFADWYCQNSFL
jgi:transcriptional regulator with XRE-family HTH domain